MDDQPLTPAQQTVRKFWHVLFTIVQVGCAVALVYWHPYMHLPPPGYAVAVIAVAAAVMSVHDGMHPWQKGLWLVLIGCLLRIELRAIAKDRAESDERALNAQRALNESFAVIRDAQNADFKTTAEGLKAALTGIGATLSTADTTLKQTMPHADVVATKFVPIGPRTQGVLPNVNYRFDIGYQNIGNDSANLYKVLVDIEVAKPYDINAQKSLAKHFESLWKLQTHDPTFASAMAPSVPGFHSEYRTFTDDEVKQISETQDTIYDLIRVEYTDKTGTWQTDSCESFKIESGVPNFNVGISCLVFQKHRYRLAKP